MVIEEQHEQLQYFSVVQNYDLSLLFIKKHFFCHLATPTSILLILPHYISRCLGVKFHSDHTSTKTIIIRAQSDILCKILAPLLSLVMTSETRIRQGRRVSRVGDVSDTDTR